MCWRPALLPLHVCHGILGIVLVVVLLLVAPFCFSRRPQPLAALAVVLPQPPRPSEWTHGGKIAGRVGDERGTAPWAYFKGAGDAMSQVIKKEPSILPKVSITSPALRGDA